ncbi:MAG: lipoprotein, partial [Muribaculaceae bacterium]|nr:lipoprotein [Muribaculaceae bacterium]
MSISGSRSVSLFAIFLLFFLSGCQFL